MVFRGVYDLRLRSSLDGCASPIPFKLEVPFQTHLSDAIPSVAIMPSIITSSSKSTFDIVPLLFPSICGRTVVDRSVASKTSCLY
jgi:hypothetical protein